MSNFFSYKHEQTYRGQLYDPGKFVSKRLGEGLCYCFASIRLLPGNKRRAVNAPAV